MFYLSPVVDTIIKIANTSSEKNRVIRKFFFSHTLSQLVDQTLHNVAIESLT